MHGGKECHLLAAAAQRPVVIGVLGTSLSFGVDLGNRTIEAWPAQLQRLLRSSHHTENIWVVSNPQANAVLT